MKKYPFVAQPKNEIVVYQPNETMRLEVSLCDESAWLPQQRIADLFGVQRRRSAPEMMFMEGEFLSEYEAIRMIVKAAKYKE